MANARCASFRPYKATLFMRKVAQKSRSRIAKVAQIQNRYLMIFRVLNFDLIRWARMDETVSRDNYTSPPTGDDERLVSIRRRKSTCSKAVNHRQRDAFDERTDPALAPEATSLNCGTIIGVDIVEKASGAIGFVGRLDLA